MKQSVKMYTLIGLPASGKSTLIKELERVCKSRNESVTAISSDNIRLELCGTMEDQSKNDEVFKTFHSRVKRSLSGGQSVIVDATNVDKKSRRAFLKIADRCKVGKIAVWLDTSKSVCLKRNKQRERFVPEFVIDRMAAKFRKPTTDEGFDSVVMVTDKTKLINVI